MKSFWKNCLLLRSEVAGTPPVEMLDAGLSAFRLSIRSRIKRSFYLELRERSVKWKRLSQEPGTGGTLVYFSCEDCAITSERAQAAGGVLKSPKFSIGQNGFISIVEDSEGNTIGLHSE